MTSNMHIQSQSNELIIDEFTNGIFNSIQEIDSQIIGYVCNSNADPAYESKLMLYNIQFPQHDQGSLIIEKRDSVIFLDGYYTHTLRFIEETGNWILIQSKMIEPTYRFYRVILCDKTFEIIDEEIVEASGVPQSFYIDSDENNTYIIGSLALTTNTILFLHYEHSIPDLLTPLLVTQAEPHDIFYITSMRIDTVTGNLLLFSHLGIYIVDKDLNIVNEHFYPEILTQDFGDVLRIHDYYYSHGLKDSSESIHLRNAVIHQYDTNFVIQKADTLGIYNHDNYPFIYNSLDHKEGEILAGGHYDGPESHFNFNQTIKKFYLAKYDEDLNLIWKKEYGGDRAYLMAGLKLLDDQSCFAYGFIYDSLEMERYPYGLYVNRDGEIVTSYTGPKESYLNITIENPGSNSLRINNQTSAVASISLFDLNGSLFFTKQVNEGLNEFNVTSLPAGAYYYEVVIDGKGRDTGIWVKAN